MILLAIYIGDKTTTAKVDRTCIEKYGISELVLMENAATSAFYRILEIEKEIYRNIKDRIRDTDFEDFDSSIFSGLPFKRIAILCGSGNNGGDGFVLARKLKAAGRKVDILFVGNQDKMSQSAQTNYDIIQRLGLDIKHYDNMADIESEIESLMTEIDKYDVLIDAIFGVGINRPVASKYRPLFEAVNSYRLKNETRIIGIDIPSGLDPDTGLPVSDRKNPGVAIRCDYTISFDYFKKGFLNYESEEYTGRVYVESLGCKKDILEEVGLRDRFISKKDLEFNRPKQCAHKGDFGRVCIFAGSKGFYGAARLATESAVGAGSGLVTLISDPDVQAVLAPNLVESMTCNYGDQARLDRLTESANSIAIGPGMGMNQLCIDTLSYISSRTSRPIVVDADAINAFKEADLRLSGRYILTPHLGEFSRLIGLEVDLIKKDRLYYAKKYARENRLVLVLKGKNTIITDGTRTIVNTTGNEGMARGGMGDCLTGIIASLAAKYDPFEAACKGVYLHGLCGDLIYKDSFTVSPSDLIKIIPKVMKLMYN